MSEKKENQKPTRRDLLSEEIASIKPLIERAKRIQTYDPGREFLTSVSEIFNALANVGLSMFRAQSSRMESEAETIRMKVDAERGETMMREAARFNQKLRELESLVSSLQAEHSRIRELIDKATNPDRLMDRTTQTFLADGGLLL